MKTVRSEDAEPVPMRDVPHRVGTILIRFLGILTLAIVVLMLIWSR